MRSGDLDKDTQVEDTDEKLQINAEKAQRCTSEGQKCLLDILINIYFRLIIYFLYELIYISASRRFFQQLQLSSTLSYLHLFLPTVNLDLRL